MSEVRAMAIGYLIVASQGRDMHELADNAAVQLLMETGCISAASGRITEFGRAAARHFRAQADLFFAMVEQGHLTGASSSTEPTAAEPFAVTDPTAVQSAETKPHEVIDAT